MTNIQLSSEQECAFRPDDEEATKHCTIGARNCLLMNNHEWNIARFASLLALSKQNKQMLGCAIPFD